MEAKIASLTIRNLDDLIKAKLRIRAAENGRSMEEEARQILAEAVSDHALAPRARKPERELGLAERIRQRVAPVGGIEMPETTREPMRDPSGFA